MSGVRLIVPPLESARDQWPSLGGPICDFIEAKLVHGPGDVLGKRATLIDEARFFIWRAYEVNPRGKPGAGRRRFKRVALSRRKGFAKTELAAWLAICEMDPECPVRFDGWRKVGRGYVPVGRPVRDPFIPMIATTKDQTEDLAYGAVLEILRQSTCELVDEYDAGEERVRHLHAPGEILPKASAPSAADGARTTFQHFDEPHLFISPRLRSAHATMLRNIAKRKASDAWSLETSTMYAPGQDSVFEGTHKYALDVQRGQIADPSLYFDHLQASETHDITHRRERRLAVIEASGDALAYTDVATISGLYEDPQTDPNDWCRYWLNQAKRSSLRWLPEGSWEALTHDGAPADDAEVVLCFMGSYDRGATVLVGCTLDDEPHLFLAAEPLERPLTVTDWRPATADVEAMVASAMERWTVRELVCVPTGWRSEVEGWEQTYGEVVVRFELTAFKLWAAAVDGAFQAVCDRRLTHDGAEILARHVADAVPVTRSGKTVLASPIPAGAAAVAIAYDRARWRRMNPEPERVQAVVIDPWGQKVADVECRFCHLVGQVRELSTGMRVCRSCGNRWPKGDG